MKQNEDDLSFLRAELNSANFGKFIQELSDDYERTEHELSCGREISAQDLAEHERIKARIQAGSSLADAMIDWVAEQYAKMYSQGRPGLTKGRAADLAKDFSSMIKRSRVGNN